MFVGFVGDRFVGFVGDRFVNDRFVDGDRLLQYFGRRLHQAATCLQLLGGGLFGTHRCWS